MFKEQAKKITSFALKGKRRYATVVIAIIFVLMIGVYAWSQGNGTYDRYVVKKGSITEEASIIGKLKAAQDITLAFNSGGTVSDVFVSVGDQVRKGDVIARLRANDVLAQRDSAYSKLEELKNGTRPEELTVKTQRVSSAQTVVDDSANGLRNAIQDSYTRVDNSISALDSILYSPGSTSGSLNIEIADQELKISIGLQRYEIESILNQWIKKISSSSDNEDLKDNAILAKQNVEITRKYFASINEAISSLPSNISINNVTVPTAWNDLSSARASVETAAGTLNSAFEKWQNAQGDLSIAQKEYSLSQAGTRSEQVSAQEAVVREYEARLDNTVIRAPFDGVITKMEASVGDRAEAGSAQAAMSSGNTFEIEAYIPEIEIGKISVGNEATVTLDAYSADLMFNATVSSIDLSETVVSGVPTYKTRLVLKENDTRMRSGMTANLVIKSSEYKDLTIIPSRALTMNEGKRVVKIPSSKNGDSYYFAPVSIGKYGADGMVEVISGLSVGDKVFIPIVNTP